MATETRSFVDIFFNRHDAAYWAEAHIDYWENDEWFLKDYEIKLMESGAYRAGVIFQKKQLDLFGAADEG